MGAYAKFWQVTGEALDHCLAAHGIADAGVRDKLMSAYLALDPFSEVPAMLDRLKRAGMRLAILSNGNPEMLDPMVAASRPRRPLRGGAERRCRQGLQARPQGLSPGRGTLRRQAGQGLLPVVQLLGRAWRGAFRLFDRVGEPRRRTRRQFARRTCRRDPRSFPSSRPAWCFLMSSSADFCRRSSRRPPPRRHHAAHAAAGECARQRQAGRPPVHQGRVPAAHRIVQAARRLQLPQPR